MPKANVHGLPEHLRKDDKGFFLDYYVSEGGIKKRKRERLGNITLPKALKIHALHARTMLDEKYVTGKSSATFFQACQAYLDYSKSRQKVTFIGDERRVALFKRFFEDRTLDSFNLALVNAFLSWRRQEFLQRRKKEIRDATLNLEIAALKTIMRQAVLNGMIERNPIEGVKKFKPYSRNRTINKEEYLKLLNCCVPHLKGIVKMGYFTGMRRGEILYLTWDQIDLENQVVHLKAEDTKTSEGREVPLNDELVRMLSQIPKVLNCPYVFTWEGHRIGDIKTAFNKACRNAGIKDFKFHDLRHTAVTNLRKAGVSDNVIMSISGHKTHAMFKKYDRVDREDRLNAMQKVMNDTGLTKSNFEKEEQVTA